MFTFLSVCGFYFEISYHSITVWSLCRDYRTKSRKLKDCIMTRALKEAVGLLTSPETLDNQPTNQPPTANSSHSSALSPLHHTQLSLPRPGPYWEVNALRLPDHTDLCALQLWFSSSCQSHSHHQPLKTLPRLDGFPSVCCMAALSVGEAQSLASHSGCSSASLTAEPQSLFNSVFRCFVWYSLTLFVDNCSWCGMPLEVPSSIWAWFFSEKRKLKRRLNED